MRHSTCVGGGAASEGCTHCHAGRESEVLEKYDFVSDEKTAKTKASEMLRMVTAINQEPPEASSHCATCHRGVTEPHSLQQVLISAYDAGGADSAGAAYRALGERYYGRAAFDFGEVPLADVASVVRSRNRLADAVRLCLLNTSTGSVQSRPVYLASPGMNRHST